jgi:hypothetical protein
MSAATILDSIPDSATLKAMIRERIREVVELRGLVRVAERRERMRVKAVTRRPRPGGHHDN